MATEIISADAPLAKRPYPPVFAEDDFESRGLVRQILFVIFKWKRLILGLCLTFTVASAIAMLVKPAVRTATAKILFKADRMPLQISGLSSQTSRVPYIPQILQSEIELLMSREVLRLVAGKLLTKGGRAEKDIDPEEIEDKIVSLRKNTVAAALPDTNIIQVTFFASTFEDAEKTLRMIVDEYMEHHAMAYSGSKKLLEFYETESKRVAADLRQAEDALKKAQEEENIASVDAQISNQIQMLADRRRALQQVEADAQTIRERDSLITKIKGDLVTAEIALQDLLQRYTESDRRVREKREQIALIKRQLAGAERVVLSSLDAQRRTVTRQINEISGGLGRLRDRKVDIDRVAREVELRRSSFMLYGKNLEEARIAARLDKEQLSDIALIEQPHATLDSGLLKEAGVVLLASMVGLILGLAVAFGMEFFSNALRTQEDVEHYLGLPVLAAVPDLRRHPLALRH